VIRGYRASHALPVLEVVSVEIPDAALAPYEAAFASHCVSVGMFREDPPDPWRLEGVRIIGQQDSGFIGALALAELMTGYAATLERLPTEADGWLRRTRMAFPEQLVGHRFAIRGTHIQTPPLPGRITLVLDAGIAFGSGEHGSTRGCLRALERLAAHASPRRILDLGTGSGVLAMAAAKLWRRPVLATDIDAASVRVARENMVRNQVSRFVRSRVANGWRNRVVAASAPYDLVIANILARPLCAMAKGITAGLEPGGWIILAGLLRRQIRMVLAAYRCHGAVLEQVWTEGHWATLMLRKG
jgi:ribosomal protein L11 methyltransferase